MGKIRKVVNRLRWGPLPERRRRVLVRLHDLLAPTAFHGRYWMIMGLVLGCVRDGEPIRWDKDSDFGFMAEDLPLFREAVAILCGSGFELQPVQINNDGRVTKWALVWQAYKVEFFLFDRHGDRIRWHYHRRKPPIELVNEVPTHGFKEFELYGRQWLMPADPDDYLTRLYGDWRTPNPEYHYWRDCSATIARHAWTGERRDSAPL